MYCSVKAVHEYVSYAWISVRSKRKVNLCASVAMKKAVHSVPFGTVGYYCTTADGGGEAVLADVGWWREGAPRGAASEK